MDIVIATKNRGKIKEIRDALNRIDIKVLSLDEIGLHIEIEEDGGTYSENAVKKAVEVAKRTGKTALSDDSGLEIDALDGRPGINSSRFAGDNADDRERNLKVLEMMKDVPPEKRGARFKCVIAIATPTFPPTFNKGGGMRGLYTCEGVCEGKIAESIRGDKGFGYDPIFIVPEYNKTFGELGAEIKDRISHRAKALEKAKEIISKMSRLFL